MGGEAQPEHDVTVKVTEEVKIRTQTRRSGRRKHTLPLTLTPFPPSTVTVSLDTSTRSEPAV